MREFFGRLDGHLRRDCERARPGELAALAVGLAVFLLLVLCVVLREVGVWYGGPVPGWFWVIVVYLGLLLVPMAVGSIRWYRPARAKALREAGPQRPDGLLAQLRWDSARADGFDIALWGSFLAIWLALMAAAALRSAGVLPGEPPRARDWCAYVLGTVLGLCRVVGLMLWYRPSRRGRDPAPEGPI